MNQSITFHHLSLPRPSNLNFFENMSVRGKLIRLCISRKASFCAMQWWLYFVNFFLFILAVFIALWNETLYLQYDCNFFLYDDLPAPWMRRWMSLWRMIVPHSIRSVSLAVYRIAGIPCLASTGHMSLKGKPAEKFLHNFFHSLKTCC